MSIIRICRNFHRCRLLRLWDPQDFVGVQLFFEGSFVADADRADLQICKFTFQVRLQGQTQKSCNNKSEQWEKSLVGMTRRRWVVRSFSWSSCKFKLELDTQKGKHLLSSLQIIRQLTMTMRHWHRNTSSFSFSAVLQITAKRPCELDTVNPSLHYSQTLMISIFLANLSKCK